MSRASTFLDTISDNATVLYANFFLLLELVSVGVLNVMIVDDLCYYGVITTSRTHVLMATTAVVIVFVAIAFYNRVTNTFFDAKMATALRIAMKVDSITTPQEAADLVTHWENEYKIACGINSRTSNALTRLQSQYAELQKKHLTDCLLGSMQMKAASAEIAHLMSENAKLQNERATAGAQI